MGGFCRVPIIRLTIEDIVYVKFIAVLDFVTPNGREVISDISVNSPGSLIPFPRRQDMPLIPQAHDALYALLAKLALAPSSRHCNHGT